jgi:hypothetical protein
MNSIEQQLAPDCPSKTDVGFGWIWSRASRTPGVAMIAQKQLMLS